MNVVNTGAIYRIYDDHLQVTEKLPAGQYIVRCSEMTGFFLEEYVHNEVKEEKIYGVHERKITKVLNSFDQFTRNLGVILSGDKGIGKSLFAKLLAKRAIEECDLAVIVVDQYIPGVHSFIESIDQEVLVIFDEFEKTFADIGRDGEKLKPMDTLLSLFDGISIGKKLFVVTCNSFNSLNDFMVNRPGRFHYHFRFDYPQVDEVREYLIDKLGAGLSDEINKVVQFSLRVNLNYDCLRAIAYELLQGESFEDAILDLNIMNVNEQFYSIEINWEDGEKMFVPRARMDMFSSGVDHSHFWCEDDTGRRTGYQIVFMPSKAEYVSFEMGSVVRGSDVKIHIDTDYFYEYDGSEDDEARAKEAIAKARARKVGHLVIKKLHTGNKYTYVL